MHHLIGVHTTMATGVPLLLHVSPFLLCSCGTAAAHLTFCKALQNPARLVAAGQGARSSARNVRTQETGGIYSVVPSWEGGREDLFLNTREQK